MTKVKLGDIGIFARGKSKHRPRNDERLYKGGGYPLVQTGDIKSSGLYVLNHSQEYNQFGLAQSKLWPEGTLAITIAANIAEASILSYPMCFPDSIVGFTADKTKTTELFMYYMLAHLRTSIQQSVSDTGSIQDNINLNYLENLVVDIPDLETQKLIADFLSIIDKKIQLNNKINSKLEAIAKLIYNYWFVQFDFPDENGKPYKSSGGKMVWNKELRRDIPIGWKVVSLLEIADYTNGIACQKYRPINGKSLPVIKIREMHEGFSGDTELVREDISEKVIVEDGDVLFSWSASLEVQVWAGGKGGLNQHIFKVTSQKFPRSFYYFQLLDYVGHFRMMAENRKTTMGHITQDHLQQSRIVLPPQLLIEDLDKKIKQMIDKVVLNKKQNKKLSELRDWLLPMLMNGQAKVT